MDSEQDYFNHIKNLLKELIQVATQLRDASIQVIAEEEMAELQNRQEALLKQLEQLDAEMRAAFGHQLDKSMQQLIHEKLSTFQKLNQEFVDNLNSSHGLIQFELRRIEDEHDFSLLRHLKSPAPAKAKKQDQ